MKRFFGAIRSFFLPPADAKTFVRVLPLAAIAILMIVLFVAATVAWEETNAVSFCGLTCHTMPPQYITHENSAHTNVSCEDCHMGRDRLGISIVRKVTYSWQTGTAMLFNTYEYPIVAKNMAPARTACENCHSPEVFTSDKLVEQQHFAADEANTLSTTFLSVKTGGGTERQGLGFGIHWHIENPVYYLATDKEAQNIPYVAVENADGTRTAYVDVESGFDPASVKPDQLVQMDCITCHNRTAHLVESPEQLADSLMQTGLVSAEIPGIKQKAVEVLSATYASQQEGLDAIAALGAYYQEQRAEFTAANQEKIDQAIQALQDAYQRTNFPDQKMDWETHPNNLAHKDSPGCFRCHDGKHLSQSGGTVRLECNLCHSIPVVSGPDQLTASLELSRGFEPDTHTNPNWITIHRDIYNDTCAGCHTVDDPGGTSNTSFCSNSACHGATWQFAGFDAPKLRVALADQIAALITPTPRPTQVDDVGVSGPDSEATPTPAGPQTYATLSGLLQARCGSCHGTSAMKGLDVLTYATLMKGGDSGAPIVPGDPDNSLLVKTQSGATKHFGQFTADELALVRQWIQEGAKEK
ncbi:MAG: NapC/NirT family cytochrome c [Anaerolineaceae bacterium]|nr:NapC/NirT family cytochrome c [Anaerolineaceae bacterium]